MSFTKQQLTSAWLDNEASSLHEAETETSAAGAAVNSDSLSEVLTAEQRALWQRYALVGSVLRGDAEVGQPLDISAQVAARVAAEATATTDSSVVDISVAAGGARTKAAMRWLKPAASAAVAASVAIVAVLSVQQWNQPMPGSESSAPGMEPALITNPLGGRNPVSYNSVDSPGASKTAAAAGSDAQQQHRRQLQSYLIDHQQQLQLRQQAEQETTPESQPPQ
ncbi:MAG: anti sigma-E factor RseA C-terminal domain-containing protein [Idiomarina sp.]